MVVGVITHVSGLSNQFTNWDDPNYLVNNPLTEAPLSQGETLGQQLGQLLRTPAIGYPIPVTMLTYYVQRSLFGLSATGFHAVSIALHALCVLAMLVLACRLRASWLAASLAAAVFAAHPLTVEPVAWVVGQKDLLAALCILCVLVVRAHPRGAHVGRSVAVAVLVLLSLAAKPNTVAAPLLIVGLDLCLGRTLRARQWVLYAVLAALAMAATVMAYQGHGALGAAPSRNVSGESILEVGWAFAMQLQHVVWPLPLVARYFAPTGGPLIVWACLGFALAVGAGLGIVILWRRGRRTIAFACSAAALAYVPTSGLIPLTRGPADSYMYLPLLLAACAAACALTPVCRIRKHRRIAVGIVVTAVLVGGGLSVRQTGQWHDSLALWIPVAEAYPDEPRAIMRVGDAHLAMKQPQHAAAVYERLRHSHPSFTTSRITYASVLERVGRVRDAERVLAEIGPSQDEALLDRYGFLLIQHPTLEPSDDEAAHRAIVYIAPLLARRGKRRASLHRAHVLLVRYGEAEHARRIEERMNRLP